MGPIINNYGTQRLLWDFICGYCNEWKKPTTIMGSYMRVLQWMKKTDDYYGILYAGIAMNEKNRRLLWDFICGYCNEWKKPTTIMGSYMRVLQWMKKTDDYYGILYAGIAMNEKNQRLLWDLMRVLQCMYKIGGY